MGQLATNNQVRHMYVCNHGTPVNANLSTHGGTGQIAIKTTADGEVFFLYDGVASVLRSDLIDKRNVMSCTLTPAASMQRALRKRVITLASLDHTEEATPHGSLIPGQDYVLRLNFNQYIGSSDEDEYFKTVSVRATQGMSVADFFKEMGTTLKATMDKDQFDLLDVTYNATSLTLTEKLQPYRRGTHTDKPVIFEAYPLTITHNAEDVIWGNVNKANSTEKVPSGRKVADLEWATTAMRGDMYKDFGWPNIVHTEYLVDPAGDYDLIDIHFYKTLSNESVQKSEKDLTIAVKSGKGSALLTTIKSALGITA